MPEFPDAEQDNAKRQVYFLTFPHPRTEFAQDGTKLVAPDTQTKIDILKKVLDACETLYAHDHMSTSSFVSGTPPRGTGLPTAIFMWP